MGADVDGVLIDPRAVVSPAATLGDGVVVGPFAVIEDGVVIGARTRIWASAYVCSGTTLGEDNVVHMGAVIGHEPQDRAYTGAPTRLRVGDRNVFREGVQLHRGTAPDTETVIGSDCYLMANAHVGHNCRVADGVVMANGAVLGGHATVGERAFLSAYAMVHQHARVGRLAMLQGGSAVSTDLPPFCVTRHGVNVLGGLNLVGLRRAGIEPARIAAIRRAYRTLFLGRPNLGTARARLLEMEEANGGPTPEVREMLDFIASAKKGVCATRRVGESAGIDD
jgi:UDP-N-acetylglucosamine acyltransferase